MNASIPIFIRIVIKMSIKRCFVVMEHRCTTRRCYFPFDGDTEAARSPGKALQSCRPRFHFREQNTTNNTTRNITRFWSGITWLDVPWPYSDIIMGVMASKSPALPLFTQPLIQAGIKTSKVRVPGLCAGNSPVTGEFPAQMASNAGMFPFDDAIMVWWPMYTAVNSV